MPETEEDKTTGAGVFAQSAGNTKSEEVNIKLDVCQEDASIYNLIFKKYDEEKNE